MTRRVKNVLLGGATAALVLAGTAGQGFAVEPGDFTNYLRGATQGLPLGAAPPPGLYAGFAVDATGLGPSNGKGNQYVPGATTLPAFGYGASLIYVPGWNFLGGSYVTSVVQGAYIGAGGGPGVGPAYTTFQSFSTEVANTNFTPFDVSWNLGHGWFGAIAFNVVAPDGSQWASSINDVNLNPDYWTFSPAAALSYLDSNWLLSANFRYDINTASRGVTMGAAGIGAAAANGFTSGNELFGDLTALYKIGKWQIGPVAYFEAQTTEDSPGNGVPCTPALCGYQSQVAVGALVGYDFGPVAMQVWFDDTVECQNAVCGFDVWYRTTFKIWGPESKPMVAKY
jgi:hypothetical protein